MSVGGFQTHNISTLKSYIVTLENESISKQSELQMVVGSKYHDFIQSGTSIELMHENAKTIENVIIQFEKFNKTIIQKTSSFSIKSVATLKFDLNQVNSNTIWEFLEVCDYLRATISCLVAASILKVGGYQSSAKHVKSPVLISLNIVEVKNLTNVVNLAQNIVDDCHLKLLDFETPIHSRAFILVSIGLLTKKTRSNLLNIYLHAVDIKLNNVLLIGKSHQELAHISKIASILQQVMFDLYYLFFYHPETNQQRGLLSEYEELIINGVNSSVHDFCVSHSNDNQQQMKADKIKLMACKISLSSETDTEHDLRRFDKWLNSTTLKISTKCSELLSLLSNALDISKLQKTVYNACVNLKVCNEVSFSHKSIYKNIDLKHDVLKNFSQTDFGIACNYLLSPKSRIRNKVNKIESNEDSNDLWKLFFRSSFQHQVLKMLRQTCESSILKIRDLMNQQIVDKQHKRILSSSSQIYHEAEYIFHLIQIEFKALFEASVFGSTSADIFCFGLFVEATRLIANMIITLRSLAITIVSDAHRSSSSGRKNNIHNSKYNGYLSSLLLVARVAFLIETRFDFFSSLFSDAQFSRLDGKISLPWSAFHNYSYLEDISIKSAFEIADTNGNGLLTFSEYNEALQALGVTEATATTTTTPSAHKNSNNSFSVSLLEFTLLCSHFTLVNSQESLSKFKMSMTCIIIYCHSQWARFTVTNTFHSTLELSNQRLLQLLSESNKNGGNNQQTTDDEQLFQDLTSSMNTRNISNPLFKFLFDISHQFYSKIISMDSVQAVNKQRSKNNYNDNVLDSYYVQLLEKSNVKTNKVDGIFDYGMIESVNSSIVYESILKVDEYVKVIQESLLQNYFMDSAGTEKCFETVLDLTVLELIVKSIMISKKSSTHDFSKLLVSIRAKKSQLQSHLNRQIKNMTESTIFQNRAKESLKKVFFLATLFSPDNQYLEISIANDTSHDTSIFATTNTSKATSGDITSTQARDQAIQNIFSSSSHSNRRLPLLPLPLRRNKI